MPSGLSSQISFALETTWGTAVVPTKSIGIHAGGGIQTDMGMNHFKAFNNTLALNQGAFKGLAKHEGSYAMDFIPGYALYFLKSALGASTPTLHSGETVVYDHTFSELSAKPSLTIEQAIDNIVRRYAGAFCTGFKFSQKMGEALQAEFTFKAKSQATATKITAAYETVKPLDFNELGATGIKIGGTSFTEVQSFELEYKNNGEVDHSISSNDPVVQFVKPSDVSFKMDLYQDTTSAVLYNTNYLTATTQSLEFIWTGAATIGSAAHYALDILVPSMIFKVVKNPISESYNLIQIEGETDFDKVTSKLISVVATNLLATLV